MPGKVKVKIISGRNLPVMDRSSDTTDAYVEIKLGTTTYKTDVCRKSLNPQWNSDWYRFEVDDSELQDEPLQIRLMDHDTYSANDAIGKVYLDLNPLLLPAASLLLKWNEGNSTENPTNSVMSGWIPVYDTMHGIRGEVNITVKVELFSDFNKFRQSSCGVQFFCSPVIPHGYFAQVVYGFVEELVVNDDPEYQWIDKIRTPRASNEARQTLFFKLSGELQRKIGLKALDLGGNAVIGYNQSFDLEGESGIVARGIGTAVTLVKMIDLPSQGNIEPNVIEERAQSYLKFLGSAKGFFLNSNSNIYKIKRPILPKLKPSPTSSLKSLKSDEFLFRPDRNKLVTRHLSREFFVPPREMLHHSISLQTLLKQEDMRGERSNSISQRFKNLKYSSQNILSKKMTALKAKLSENSQGDDQTEGDEKKRQFFKYRRTQSDSTGMAEILVRSVCNATSSLDCITESPNSLKRNVSVLSEEPLELSYLSLPDTSTGTHSSNASSTSSDTSSLDEDNNFDDKTNIELDTVSHIVETVRKLSMIHSPIQNQLQIDNFMIGDDSGNKSDDGFTSETLGPDSISNVDTLSLDRESVIELHFHDNKIMVPSPNSLLTSPLIEEVNMGSFTAPATPVEMIEEPFFPELSASCNSLKETPTIIDLVNFEKPILGQKFSSLHNIYDPGCKMNDYSSHKGKETVLGHIFKRIEPVHKEQPKTLKLKSNSFHNLQDISKFEGDEEKETVLGELFHKPFSHFQYTAPIVESRGNYFFAKPTNIKKSATGCSLATLGKNDKYSSLHNIHNRMYRTTHSRREKDESVFHKYVKSFHQSMKKSSTAYALSDMDPEHKLHTKFTSLHNIHDESSKMNNYSAHKGKETVLGALFKHIPKDLVKEKLLHVPKNLLHKFHTKPGEHEESKSKFYLPESEENDFDLSKENNSNTSSTFYINECQKNAQIESPNGKQSTKENRKDNFLHSPRGIFKRSSIKHEGGLLGTALGNVLMESVNDILATSQLEKERGNRHDNEIPPITSDSCPTTPKSVCSIKSTDSIKEKIFNAPKALIHKIDAKISRKSDNNSDIKNPHGLLNTALQNVLLDSVNDVIATTDLPSPHVEIKEEPKKKKLTQKILKAPKTLFLKIDSKLHKKEEDGLLKCALENVLMEAVNDALVTPQKSSPESVNQNKLITPEIKEPSPPKSEEIPSRPNNNLVNKIPDLTVKPPINTEIDIGNSDSINTMHACLTPLRNVGTPPSEIRTEMTHQRTESVGTKMSHSPVKINSIPCIHRRSSDSDLSITPKGNSLTGSSGGGPSGQFMRNAMIRSTIPQENFDILEYPFLTMSKYPTGFIAYIGGAVSARSVKLLERITNIEEPESRDTWWSEIRMEIRSHARALNCNAVLGYTEMTSICDDVCVLSANGTAAVIGYPYTGESNDNLGGLPIIPRASNKDMMTTSLDRNDFEKEKPAKVEVGSVPKQSLGGSPEREPVTKQSCNICHLPYLGNSVQLRNSSSKCNVCRTGKVPDVLIATIEIPEGIPSVGRGCFVQSYVCRPLRDLKGESNAKEISDGLPFLEYELHRLLINKLKVKGMNAVFGLKVRISVGDRMLIGIATGTAVYLSPLPNPPLPKLVSDRTADEKLAQLQKSLHDTVKKNKEIYQLKISDETNGRTMPSDTDDSEDEQTSLDLSIGNKDCCILEVDDPEDVDVLNALMEPRPPDGFHVVNTEMVPGLEELEIVKNLQMFTQIWRAKIQPHYNLDKHFHRLLQSVYFKLRRMIPCALCDLQFRVDSPEPDEIQLCVLGMALGLGDPQKNSKNKRKNIVPKRIDDELIFNLEEDLIPENSIVQTSPNSNLLHTQTLKHKQKSPIRNRAIIRQRHVPYRERHGVDITPLSYVPGGKIEKYLGNLNFFFIRETTSIREEGGLSGFIHSFVTEILAIVRAHVTALGGNAMVAYFLTECVMNHNLHKNQGQCLINVGGDVVYVSYYSEDH